MSSQSLLGQLNYVLDLFVNYRAGKTDTLASWVGVDDTAKAGRSKGSQALESGVDKLIDLIPGLKGTASRDLVREELLPRLMQARAAGVKFTGLDADAFEQALLSLPNGSRR